MKFETRYDHKKQPGVTFVGPSLTKSDMAEQSDINNIMAKYQKFGQLPDGMTPSALFADVADYPDYQEAQDKIRSAKEAFMSLNARVRERFSNDPSKILEFLQDPENKSEAVKLGLMVEQAPIQPVIPDAKISDSSDPKA